VPVSTTSDLLKRSAGDVFAAALFAAARRVDRTRALDDRAWLEDGPSAVALMSLHVVTAVVVITGFAATLPARR